MLITNPVIAAETGIVVRQVRKGSRPRQDDPPRPLVAGEFLVGRCHRHPSDSEELPDSWRERCDSLTMMRRPSNTCMTTHHRNTLRRGLSDSQCSLVDLSVLEDRTRALLSRSISFRVNAKLIVKRIEVYLPANFQEFCNFMIDLIWLKTICNLQLQKYLFFSERVGTLEKREDICYFCYTSSNKLETYTCI